MISYIKRSRNRTHRYADMLFDGIGTEQDIATAIPYYQMAADRGNNEVRIKVSALMNSEKDDNRTEIRKLFKELTATGNPLTNQICGSFIENCLE